MTNEAKYVYKTPHMVRVQMEIEQAQERMTRLLSTMLTELGQNVRQHKFLTALADAVQAEIFDYQNKSTREHSPFSKEFESMKLEAVKLHDRKSYLLKLVSDLETSILKLAIEIGGAK